MNFGKWQSRYDALGWIDKGKFRLDPRSFIDVWEQEELEAEQSNSSVTQGFENFLKGNTPTPCPECEQIGFHKMSCDTGERERIL